MRNGSPATEAAAQRTGHTCKPVRDAAPLLSVTGETALENLETLCLMAMHTNDAPLRVMAQLCKKRVRLIRSAREDVLR